MNQLMTKDDVKNFDFFQMPKAFFSDSKYHPMRVESKLAYMIMLDLFSLSVKNNWVSSKGQVYIKLSRSKMMDLLHIKGTQKAAAIIKELVDYKLILSKKSASHGCNKIFLYHVDSKSTRCHKQAQEPAQLPGQEDDLSQFQALIEDQVHLEDLRQRYAPDLLDEVINNIYEMYANENTRIGKENKSKAIIRSVILKLEMHHIEHVMDQFYQVASKTEITNPRRYIQTMIYNSVCEAKLKIISHVKYNFGY